jgi:hypothetical protein
MASCSSSTAMAPSRKCTQRCAYAAMSGSWVTITIVLLQPLQTPLHLLSFVVILNTLCLPPIVVHALYPIRFLSTQREYQRWGEFFTTGVFPLTGKMGMRPPSWRSTPWPPKCRHTPFRPYLANPLWEHKNLLCVCPPFRNAGLSMI